uniref:Uncharacterized protein n=1 Tax=viral metagenome TaxID=1070528 RepID=A0A6C0I656_9ZZZZ
MSYTSVNFNNSSWINKQLESYGARTSGSLEQRQERLHRFMSAEEKIALRTPTKPRASPAVAPPAPRKQARTGIIPAILIDNAEDEYEELRILAEAAGMAEENEEADDENDSDYVPEEEDDDDDVSMVGDEDLTEEDHVELAITDTWQIYLLEKSRRALRELSDLVSQLRTIRREQARADRE